MASIAINGPGRIGRAALKILRQADGTEVVAANMLPASAALATAKAPALAGKFNGAAIRALIPVGSIADVVAVTARPTTRDELNDALRDEAAGDWYRGILGVADDPVVSPGIIGVPRASVVDALMTQVVDPTALDLPAPDLSQVQP